MEESRYVKVEGSSTLLKDKATGAIINNSNTALAQHRENRQRINKQKAENAAQLESLQGDIAELKGVAKELQTGFKEMQKLITNVLCVNHVNGNGKN